MILFLDSELWHLTQKVKDAPAPNPKAQTTIPFMAAVRQDAQALPLLSALSVMSLELRASILTAKKANIRGEETLRPRRTRRERPPLPRTTTLYPSGETEGLVLLQAGDFSGAHAAYGSVMNSGEQPSRELSLQHGARKVSSFDRSLIPS